MWCILLSIVKLHTVFGVLLSKLFFSVQFSQYVTSWLLSKSFSGWWFDHHIFTESKGFVCFITKAMLLSVWSMNGLYVQSQSFTMSIPHVYWSPCVSAYTDNYHSRLSHPSSRVFNFLVSNNKMTCNSRSFNFQCQACPLGKSSRLSLGSTGH
jgi:hypothetical protein